MYSFQGETDMALDYLRKLTNKNGCPIWIANYFYLDPMLDNVRDEPEFKEIHQSVNKIYQNEHDAVKSLLISEGIL